MSQILSQTYDLFYQGVLMVLIILVLLCLLRAVLGPTVADRVVAINMMGTMVMVMIAVLALRLKEGYLVDICMIYAMISFLAVIVLTKIYMGVYLAERNAAPDSEEPSVPEKSKKKSKRR